MISDLLHGVVFFVIGPQKVLKMKRSELKEIVIDCGFKYCTSFGSEKDFIDSYPVFTETGLGLRQAVGYKTDLDISASLKKLCKMVNETVEKIEDSESSEEEDEETSFDEFF